MNRIMLDERDSFYKVDEQSILMAEESMEIKFPSELLDFYREIGYGFLKSDFGNVNRIMDPSSIADFRLQRGPYSCDPDVEIYKEFDEKRLVFFEYSDGWEPLRPLKRATRSAWRSQSDSIYIPM